MIDDKKIEEATRNYINKNGYFIKYDEEPCIDIEFAYKEGYKEGCKDAINEFLKDLWHPASEEPVEDKPFLAQEVGRWRVGVNSPLIPNNEWSTQRKIRGIKRWLYVEDLLPKKKGDKNERA